jgi:hypothetical protein
MKVNFETKYFQKKKFTERAIARYFNNALKDLQIAGESKYPEVIFKFSYDSLIKGGITLIAFYGYKVKSRQGHHIKVLEKLSQILANEKIEIVGDRIRKKRNLDLYEGGIIISKNEAKVYLNFTKDVIILIERYIKKQESLFEQKERKD